MRKYTRNIPFSTLGKEISNNWNAVVNGECRNILTEYDEAKTKRIKEQDVHQDIKCLLAYISTKTPPIGSCQFKRVHQYLTWIKNEFEVFIAVRELKHGKCPAGIKASISNYLTRFTGSYSFYYKKVESGEIQFIDNKPYYYGQTDQDYYLKRMMKHSIKSMSIRTKNKYNIWMKSKPRKGLK
jgi:hypothetical protein